MNQPNIPPQDTVIVRKTAVSCDGGNPVIGHPQVFLHINHQSKDVVCPYCEKRFILEQ